MRTLSRNRNGAVDVGNTDLILPVRVRTRAEDVDRTSEASQAPGGRSQCAARNGRSEEASRRYSEGWRVGLDDVRASAPMCEALRSGSLPDLLERRDTVILSGYSGAWRRHLEIRVFPQTGEVPRRLRCLRRSKGDL